MHGREEKIDGLILTETKLHNVESSRTSNLAPGNQLDDCMVFFASGSKLNHISQIRTMIR